MKSPVWKIVPTGVLNAIAMLPATEWHTWINSAEKYLVRTVCPSRISRKSPSTLRSVSLLDKSPNVSFEP